MAPATKTTRGIITVIIIIIFLVYACERPAHTYRSVWVVEELGSDSISEEANRSPLYLKGRSYACWERERGRARDCDLCPARLNLRAHLCEKFLGLFIGGVYLLLCSARRAPYR